MTMPYIYLITVKGNSTRAGTLESRVVGKFPRATCSKTPHIHWILYKVDASLNIHRTMLLSFLASSSRCLTKKPKNFSFVDDRKYKTHCFDVKKSHYSW